MMRTDQTYWLMAWAGINRVDDVEAAKSAVQDLEGEGFRRPALLIADACLRSR